MAPCSLVEVDYLMPCARRLSSLYQPPWEPKVTMTKWLVFKNSKPVVVHATKALERREGIAPTHSRPWYWMEWVVRLTHWPRFSTRKGRPVPIVQEARWIPESVWTQRLDEKSPSPLSGIDLRSHVRPARSQTVPTELPCSQAPYITGIEFLVDIITEDHCPTSEICAHP
jgi:hypothetical protein